ncbi:MAG: LuxR C-terminal-related transcriptional regulator [Saprospiraceae bacterium]
MKPIEVAILEDDEKYRKALQTILNGAPGFSCKGVYARGEDAVPSLIAFPPDIALVDINLKGSLSGIEAMYQVKETSPNIKFLILTVYEDDDKIFNALEAGASGYLLKDTSFAKIIEAIRELFDGGSPMSASIARKVVESFRKPNPIHKNPYDQVLTRREREVLELISRGLPNKQIAAELFISLETIKSHCHSIFEKLHVQSRVEAVNKFFKR